MSGFLFYDYNFECFPVKKDCRCWNNFLKVIKITTLFIMIMLGLHHIDKLIIKIDRKTKDIQWNLIIYSL